MKTTVEIRNKDWHPNRLIQLENGVVMYTAAAKGCGIVLFTPNTKNMVETSKGLFKTMSVGFIFHPELKLSEQPYTILPSGTAITFDYETD